MKVTKTLILFLIILNFQSLTKAEDVNDLEIDGLSLGESMLKYISKNEIKNSIQNYFEDERQYYVIYYKKNMKIFDDFEIYLKTGDEKYIIRSLNAGLYPDNLNDCLNQKEKIVNDLSSSLNVEFRNYNNMHSYYTNTNVPTSETYFKSGYITIQCLFFDPKDKQKHPLLVDNLAVQVISNEIDQWFGSGYK